MPNAENAADGQLVTIGPLKSTDGGFDIERAAAGQCFTVRTAQTGANGIGILEDGTTHTLDGTGAEAIAFAENQRGEFRTSGIAPQLSAGGGKPGSGYAAVAYCLREDPGGIGQGHNTNFVSTEANAHGVRDFTGLPEGLDSARYRALGNAVTVQVSRWIAERIIAQTAGATCL